MKSNLFTLILFILLFSCNNESVLTFSEITIQYDSPTVVEINIPKLNEDHKIATSINKTLETHISCLLSLDDSCETHIPFKTAIQNFNTEYNTFKTNFEEPNLIWEGLFDGEVSYQSSEVISIPITSYLNTGGAHGNLSVTFFNFDVDTGQVLSLDDIVNDLNAFKSIAKSHFVKTLNIQEEATISDYFFGEDFRLSETIGFNNEGIILFYNVYEIASYNNSPTQFIIPFDEIESLLKKF